MSNKNIHSYSVNANEVDEHCIFCGKRIPNIDFEYEDYFIVFRGFTKNCVKGFICMDCYNTSYKDKR